jgi:hypothetical protein
MQNKVVLISTHALAALLAGAAGFYPLQQAVHPEARCCSATIRARVPAGTGKVYLSGSLDQLGPWRADARLMSGTGRERSVRVTVSPDSAMVPQLRRKFISKRAGTSKSSLVNPKSRRSSSMFATRVRTSPDKV